jgi:hypothetical protein
LVTRTEVNFQEFSQKIDYANPVFLIGSCFSDNIGGLLKYHQFSCISNPFGTVYNPISIAHQVRTIVDQTSIDSNRFVHRDENVYHLDFHSEIFDKTESGFSSNVSKRAHESYATLKNASHVFITLGTAWVYTWQKDHQIVANCQKLSNSEFNKKLLTIEEITEGLNENIDHIRSINPEAHIIFTISPVRHIKDGIVENTRSKSRLIESVHQIVDQEKNHYLPVYEMVMDDLRDYRYYKEDMIHPSDVAIKYIWEKLTAAIFSKTTQEQMKLAAKIQSMKVHKPFDENGSAYQRHLVKIAEMEIEWNKLFSKH